MITHQRYYFVAIHLLVDHQLWLQKTKYKQLKCISVLNFNMSIMALTGLLTGLKEFNLLIPWPYTGTNVVVELNWKSRKNKKNDKHYFVTNIVLQYCYTISAFDFQNVLIFKVYWFVESERRLSILLEISKLTFAVIPSSNSYLVMYTKDIFANVSVSLVHIKPGLRTLAVSIDLA